MSNQNSDSFDKKGVLKAMGIALAAALLGIGILGWQYRQLEKEKIPSLEKEIESQKSEIEEQSAQALLDKFMLARVSGNTTQAMRYLTENAVEQLNSGESFLSEKVESYEILNSEKLGEGKFRFAVKIYEEGEAGDFVEVIILVKILDKYYVDSVEMAG